MLRCRNKTFKWSNIICRSFKYKEWYYNNINDYNPSRKQKIFNCVWWLIKYFNP